MTIGQSMCERSRKGRLPAARITPAASLLLAAMAGLALLSGCSPDFEPYNRLRSLRVMAIQSEPAAPITGETATLSALVFTAGEDQSVTYSWSWCPFPAPAEQGYRCLVTEDQLAPFGPLPPLNLGTGTTAMLPNSIAPEILRMLCEGTEASPIIPNCNNGFPIQIRLAVHTDAGATDPADDVVAVVTARWRFDPATTPNANPTVDGLSVVLDGQPTPIDDQATVTLPRDRNRNLLLAVSPSASETYQGMNDEGETAELQERLFVTWFIETGNTDSSRTSYFPDRTSFEEMLKNMWTPAPEDEHYPKDTARIYTVIHDNRGGVGWRSGTVRLGSTP